MLCDDQLCSEKQWIDGRGTHSSLLKEPHAVKSLLYVGNLVFQTDDSSLGVGLHELIFPDFDRHKSMNER